MAARICTLPGLDLEIHLSSPEHTQDERYVLSGSVQGTEAAALCRGGALLVEVVPTGLAYEAYFTEDGAFTQELTLSTERDNQLHLAVCGHSGELLASALTTIYSERGGAKSAPTLPIPLQPDWPEFARLVKNCLILAGAVADRTGRNREELFEHVYAQERYAEQAWQQQDGRQYKECVENLKNFHDYLERMQGSTEEAGAPTADDIRREMPILQREIQSAADMCRQRGRADLAQEAAALQGRVAALEDRARTNLAGAVKEINDVYDQLDRIVQQARTSDPAATSRGYPRDG